MMMTTAAATLTMTATDWVLLAVVAVSALFGLMRGFIGVLASLAAWVLAGWAAFHFGAGVAVVIAGGSQPGPSQLFGGYVLSFLVVLIVVGLVGWGVRTVIRSIGLSGIDRFLGFVLGLVRGGFIACVLVLLLGFTQLPQAPDWQRSWTVPIFRPGAQWLRGWLPDWAAVQVALEKTAMPIEPLTDAMDAIALPLPRSGLQTQTNMPAAVAPAGETIDNGDATRAPTTQDGAAAPSPTDA